MRCFLSELSPNCKFLQFFVKGLLTIVHRFYESTKSNHLWRHLFFRFVFLLFPLFQTNVSSMSSFNSFIQTTFFLCLQLICSFMYSEWGSSWLDTSVWILSSF